MRQRASPFRTLGAIVALLVALPLSSHASAGAASEARAQQAGEDQWVPSLLLTAGFSIQQQRGLADSCLFPAGTGSVPASCDSESDPPMDPPLRGFFDGNDLAVSPFVGGALELMTPALAIPTRPRLFIAGEILSFFASNRALAFEGAPDCVRGPTPGDPCARDDDGTRSTTFSEASLNGQGTRTTAQVDTLAFGASFGLAFPLQFGKRQLRIKPSVSWIHYKVKTSGLVVNGACDPTSRCTTSEPFGPGFPLAGFLRETILTASSSKRFNGIGPGLDLELDTGQYGPLGVSLFLGVRAYAILGDLSIPFGAALDFDDQLGTDQAVGRFEVEVDPWVFRTHVGIRFQWLGSQP